VQDYEPLFAQLGSPRSDRALLSYRALPGAALYAKTHFIRNVVMARHGMAVAKVDPSLNRSLFHAQPRQRTRGATVTAMVRPRTPRRRPGATLDTLALIKAALGEKVTIMTFGCDQHEFDAFVGKSTPQLDHLGVLRPEDVAHHLRRCDVFIDASAYQGFGRAGLEAMAAGAVPVLPALGGVNEYATDGESAILFEDDSPTSIAEIVVSVLKDRARLRRLAAAGAQRATRYSLDRAARTQFDFFAALAGSRSLD
jgi:glycosyltransferase involved in cell wall biosynthesis